MAAWPPTLSLSVERDLSYFIGKPFFKHGFGEFIIMRQPPLLVTVSQYEPK